MTIGDAVDAMREKEVRDSLAKAFRVSNNPQIGEALAWQKDLRLSVNQFIADVFEPLLKNLINNAAHDSADDKRKICGYVNGVLNEAGLAIVDPKNKCPSHLKVSWARPTDPGRIYLAARGPTHGKVGTRIELPLDELHLCQEPSMSPFSFRNKQ